MPGKALHALIIHAGVQFSLLSSLLLYSWRGEKCAPMQLDLMRNGPPLILCSYINSHRWDSFIVIDAGVKHECLHVCTDESCQYLNLSSQLVLLMGLTNTVHDMHVHLLVHSELSVKQASHHLFFPSSWTLLCFAFVFFKQAFLQFCLNPESVAWIRSFPKRRSVSSGLLTPCLWWRFLPWPCRAGCTSCSLNPGMSSVSAGTTCLTLVGYFSEYIWAKV